MRSILTSLFFCIFLCTGIIFSQTPSTLSMQGVLRDATGAAVADGPYYMTFNIYSAPTGGTSLWTETQPSVAVQNGVYSVQLGSVTPLSTVPFNQQYYIGVSFGNTGIEMSPRITLTAAPYAMGFKGTANVFGSSGNVGIGTLSPSNKLTVSGSIKADTIISGTFNNTGDVNITGNITASSSNISAKFLGLSGNAFISGNTTMAGTAHVIGNTTMDGTAHIAGITTIDTTLKVGTISPTDKLVVTGKIKSGSQYVQTANADTRIIFGIVNADGTVSSNSGDFTVLRISAGKYKITFNTAVTTLYAVTTAIYNSTAVDDSRYFTNIHTQTGASFRVNTSSISNSPLGVDVAFEFIAIVSRDNFGL